MLVFAIKGNVHDILYQYEYLYKLKHMHNIAIKKLLLNVIIGITCIAHALLYILPDPP